MASDDLANGGSTDIFFIWWAWFYLWGLTLFKGMDIEFKDNYVGILQENEM